MADAEIGLIGLGTMGAALALNIADKGFAVAVWNRTVEKVGAFHRTAGPLADRIVPCETPEALVAALKPPRAVLLMVPAGEAVDKQIAALRPLLSPGDVIVDGGNANFHDTARRVAEAEPVAFFGVGVSGGEDGARNGPSIMGGGPRQAWDRVAPILTAVAADYDGTPCAAWLGEGGAGHFVKTVHNGIEYAEMQAIAEVYGILRDGAGRSAAEIGAIFSRWDDGPLDSYLTEITAMVAAAVDPETDSPMLDVILDRAGQKGTGRWTAIEAQHLAAPVPGIEAAVAARNLSARHDARQRAQETFGAAPRRGEIGVETLEGAMIAGKVLTYAQGFAMIAAASEAFGWELPLPTVARIWRAGCIIRSAMLDDMATALEDGADNLLFAPHFSALLQRHHDALRETVAVAVRHGWPVPALAANLSYFDMLRTGRGTANMIQAQRDYFGAHGFDRIDGRDIRHGPWSAA
ncbi:NADP-dependent phosphogluconate dehydrogenase [Rhodobacteraceae bacterium CCMM004]|nr:NADP-dependent phosphogluconate dehydrogenase [Rhodobacteraceae bacterium CCMM004]